MTDLVTPGPARVVYGPCPACGNWQLDVPYDEAPDIIEAILREHDAEDHPGVLQQLLEAQHP